MAPSRLALALLLFCSCQRQEDPVARLPLSIREDRLEADRPFGGASSSARLLWLAQHGQIEEALAGAEELLRERRLDHAVLEHLGIVLLRSGLQSKDSQDQLLTLIGASIAGHEATREILHRACRSSHPLVQIHALQGLAAFTDEETDREMIMACGSPWLPVRLIAAQILASKRSPHVVVQVEAMLSKLPWQVHPYLPSLLARVNTPEAIRLCEHQLASRFLPVRVAAVDALRQAGRDDCCDRFREMATHDTGPQAEACARALAALGDGSAVPVLEKLLDSPELTTRLAAACGLRALGHEEAFEMVRAEARAGNPFAIIALSPHRQELDLLRELVQKPSLPVRIHAALALLRQRDPACLPMVRQMLRPGLSMPAIEPLWSPGQALSAYSFRLPTLEDLPRLASFKESLLMQAIELPEEAFLALAQEVLEDRQPELVPIAVRLLENLQTPDALQLLRQERQRAGAPLSRIAAALALYRAGEPGPWEQQLLSWLWQQSQHQLIQLKEEPKWDPEKLSSEYELSPEQTSQLIIESLESLVQRQSDQAALLVLEWLRKGHPRNRYVLAGILMRLAG
jgi:HEAT repeat protein